VVAQLVASRVVLSSTELFIIIIIIIIKALRPFPYRIILCKNHYRQLAGLLEQESDRRMASTYRTQYKYRGQTLILAPSGIQIHDPRVPGIKVIMDPRPCGRCDQPSTFQNQPNGYCTGFGRPVSLHSHQRIIKITVTFLESVRGKPRKIPQL
jgi:hypothetical protein